MDNPFISPAVLSLCPGMLGLERGIERVIGRTRKVAYVEIEAFVIENLVRQMEQGVLAPAPIWSDVKTFPWRKFRNKIHWITGGYPCQPFSHAGLRNGIDDPLHLYPFISRGIKESRPMGVFFENVEGHLSLGLRDVCKDLRKMGYSVEVGLFSAAEVGAPHRRNRVFILGLENSIIKRVRGWYNEEMCGLSEKKCQSEHGPIVFGRGGEPDGIPNANKQGFQEYACGKFGGLSGTNESLKRGEFSRIYAKNWPARPGQPQHGWEAPRLESSLGYAINGYNFREDLLRMAGNAVVEQTAEVAFRTLLQKFL